MIGQIYNSTTGQILKTVTAQNESDIASEVGAGEAYIIGDGSDATHYIADPGGTPAITALASMTPTVDTYAITANDTAESTVSALPVGASISVDGSTIGVIPGDGQFVMTASTAGSFAVLATLVGYFSWGATINAT